MHLDDAIEAAGEQLTKKLTSGKNIAVVSFASSSNELSEHVIEVLTGYLVNHSQLTVVERKELDLIREEQNFQLSDDVDEETAKSIGKMYGADYLLTGNFRRVGTSWRLTLRCLDVEKGAIESMPQFRVNNSRQIHYWITGEEPEELNSPHLWTVGISGGTSFAAPWLIATINGTVAPFRYSFLEAGCDIGFVSATDSSGYYSVYPYLHYAMFNPFAKKGGWYAGGGAGWMFSTYTFDDLKVPTNTFALGFTGGVNIGDMLNVSYTLRTNLKSVNHKISVGLVYRFNKEEM